MNFGEKSNKSQAKARGLDKQRVSSPHMDKSPARPKKPSESTNEASFLSRETTGKRRVLAIVSLNIEENCEKLVIYEGQDIYELATSMTRKYQLSKDFTTFITESIRGQIQEHNLKKKAGLLLDKPKEDTPKFRNNAKERELNNHSRSIERNIAKSPRKTSPLPSKTSRYTHEETGSSMSSLKRTYSPNTLRQPQNLNSSKFNESLNKSIGKLDPKNLGFSPRNKLNKFSKPTVVVGKDLKIIENNIIFLPNNFLSKRGLRSEDIKSKPSKKPDGQTYTVADPEEKRPKKTTKKIEESLNLSDKFLLDLQEIFALLDSDHDGLISPSKIELLKLDPNILAVIQEILIEMDERAETLSFGDFLNKIEKFRLEVRLHEFLREKELKSSDFSPKHSLQFSFGDLTQMMGGR